MVQGGPDGAVPVYDPRGVVTATPQPIAPRVERIEGLRLAVFDNTKWNAGKLLRRTTERLAVEHRLGAVNCYRKDSFSREAAPELIDAIARENDIVLTAIGD
jgi:hypothetical protein